MGHIVGDATDLETLLANGQRFDHPRTHLAGKQWQNFSSTHWMTERGRFLEKFSVEPAAIVTSIFFLWLLKMRSGDRGLLCSKYQRRWRRRRDRLDAAESRFLQPRSVLAHRENVGAGRRANQHVEPE